MMVKGITANNVDNQPGVSATQRSSSISTGSRSPRRDRRLGLRPAEVQPRGDRGVPDHHQSVRRHAGPIDRHPGAGDQPLRHQRPGGSVYGSFRDTSSTRPTRRQARAAVSRTSRSAARSAGRSSRTGLHYFASYEYERAAADDLPAAGAAAGAVVLTAEHRAQQQPARPLRSGALDQQQPVGPRLVLELRGSVQRRQHRPPVERVAADEAAPTASSATDARHQREHVLRSCGSATTTSTGRICWPCPRWPDTPNYVFSGLDHRRAAQLPAGVPPEPALGALRPHLQAARTTSRSAASTSAGTTPASGTCCRAASSPSRRTRPTWRRDSPPRRGTTRRRGTSPASTPARSASTRTSATGRSTFPRPSWGIWFGDNWRVHNRLTLNYGVRWDVDWGAMAPPGGEDQHVLWTPAADWSLAAADRPAGGRRAVQDRHPRPRQRGAAGRLQLERHRRQHDCRFAAAPASTTAPSSRTTPSASSRSTASDPGQLVPERQPARVPARPDARRHAGRHHQRPRAAAGAVAARASRHDLRMPMAWQSSIGFQKQIGR